MNLQNGIIASPRSDGGEQNFTSSTSECSKELNCLQPESGSENNMKQRKRSFASKILLDFRNNFSMRESENSTDEKTFTEHTGHLQDVNLQSAALSSSSVDENRFPFKSDEEIKYEIEKRILKRQSSNVLPELNEIGNALVQPGKTNLTSPFPPLKLAPIKKSSNSTKPKKSSKTKKSSDRGFENDSTKSEASFELKNYLESLDIGPDSVFEPLETSTDVISIKPTEIEPRSSPKKLKAVTRKNETNIVSQDNAGFSKTDNVTKIPISENNFADEYQENKSISKTVRVISMTDPGIHQKRKNNNLVSSQQSRPNSRSHRSASDVEEKDLSTQNKLPRDRSKTLSSTPSSAQPDNNSRTKNVAVKKPRNRKLTAVTTQFNNSHYTLPENTAKSTMKIPKKGFVSKPVTLSTENSLLVKDPTARVKKRRSGTIEINVDDENNFNNVFSRHTSASSAARSGKVDSTSIRKISVIHMKSNTGKKR